MQRIIVMRFTLAAFRKIDVLTILNNDLRIRLVFYTLRIKSFMKPAKYKGGLVQNTHAQHYEQ